MRLLSYKKDASSKDQIYYSENTVVLKTEDTPQKKWLRLLFLFMPIIGVVGTIIPFYCQKNTDYSIQKHVVLFFFLIFYVILSSILIYFQSSKFVSRKISSVKCNNEEFSEIDLKSFKKFLDGEQHQKKPVVLAEMNDILIIDVQKKLEIFRHRLENLSYEAVFLGALTFATFVQLASSERIGILETESSKKGQVSEKFNITSEFYEVISFKWQNSDTQEMKNYEISIIIMGSLISSVFYVIVLMKRFSILRAIEKAQLKVEKAKTWNNREEIRHADKEPNGKSPERFTDLIQKELATAFELSENIDSNLGITSLVRMIALLMFFVVLLTASYIIHPKLCLLILFTSLYGLIASIIMFGFRKRMYQLFMLKHHFRDSYEFIIVTK
jgi:ABC-type multidrug transport system fused ATPase/permease subunit